MKQTKTQAIKQKHPKNHPLIIGGFFALCVCGLVFIGISTIHSYTQTPLTLCQESDSCCKESLQYVYSTQKTLTLDQMCPEQTRPQKLPCKTSVTWCEPQ
jgi:hypothetical protein